MELTLLERIAGSPEVKMPPAHLGLAWQQASENDFEQIAALVSQVEREGQPARPTMVDDLEHMFSSDSSKVLQRVIMGRDQAGVLQAVGAVVAYPGEKMRARADLFAVTNKKWQGRGIGRSLLNWQDALARQLLLEAYGPDCTLPMRIRNTVDSRALDRRMLYAAAGFSCKRKINVFRLDMPLSNVELACRLRQHTSEDYKILSISALTDVQLAQLRQLHMENSLRLEVTEQDAQRWLDRVLQHLAGQYSFAAFSPNGQLAAYALTRQRQILCEKQQCLSVEICGTHPNYPNALSVCTNTIIDKVQKQAANISRIYAEDNHPECGAQGQALFKSGFALVGTRMIYSVEV